MKIAALFALAAIQFFFVTLWGYVTQAPGVAWFWIKKTWGQFVSLFRR